MQPTDVCSIKDAINNGNLNMASFQNHLHSAEPRKLNRTIHRNYTYGAIVSVYTVNNRTRTIKRWECQLQNHDTYCKKHGYKCYFITDRDHDWKRRHGNLPGHWLKIQVIRELLSQHPWVLYLDTDTIFNNPKSTPSIEDVLNLSNNRSVSLYMPGGKGWSTDMIFIRNTKWSERFLEHFWKLRHFCPDCNAEQCAGTVAMYDAMIVHAGKQVANGSMADKIRIAKDRNIFSCCNPRSFCEYPTGSRNNRNHGHNKSPQGCVWNWQSALGFNIETATPEFPIRTDHEHIAFDIDIRQGLNVSHPVKDMTCTQDSFIYKIPDTSIIVQSFY
jgi:hypothetical protein